MTDPVVRPARYRAPILARLAEIQRVVAAWEAGALTPDARATGATEAHRLAGTLGVFGEEVGSDLGRQLELLFGQAGGSSADGEAVARGRELVDALRERVEAALSAGEPPAPTPAGPASVAAPGVADERGSSILVADDDEVIAHLLTSALGRLGYTVIRAHDGAEVVECVRARHVDLVFMDVQMPHVDGLQACRALRNDARHARLPIVVMTAQGGPNDEPEALAAGATACLAKPFSLGRVRELARTWLGRPHGS